MKKDVLFIIHDLYQEDNQFPLNIGYLSAILENAGYSVEVYCMDVYHYTIEDLVKKLNDNEYKIIGLSFLAARFKETVLPLCEAINKNKKDAWLVLGGHGPSAIPEYIKEKTNCDIVVIGEGEQAILDIMKDKENGIKKDFYQLQQLRDLDSIPYPAWHLFPMDIYTTNMKFQGMVEGDKCFQVISSRGCINECTFCYREVKGIRLRKLENVVEEIKLLKDRYGINTIQFQDEMFLISKKRIKKLYSILKENKLDIKFIANARVDIIDEEIILLLKEMGCILLNIGFESSSQDVLNHMKKNTTIKQNINVLELCKKHKIGYGLNFMWGYPEDTHRTLINNVNLIKMYNTYSQLRTIRPVTPYPGCELYYEAIEKGLLDGPEDFFNKFTNSDLLTVNFTRYPAYECYKYLFCANVELIKDYYLNVDMPIEKKIKDGSKLINNFAKLYAGIDINFRGARHYKKET